MTPRYKLDGTHSLGPARPDFVESRIGGRYSLRSLLGWIGRNSVRHQLQGDINISTMGEALKDGKTYPQTSAREQSTSWQKKHAGNVAKVLRFDATKESAPVSLDDAAAAQAIHDTLAANTERLRSAPFTESNMPDGKPELNAHNEVN